MYFKILFFSFLVSFLNAMMSVDILNDKNLKPESKKILLLGINDKKPDSSFQNLNSGPLLPDERNDDPITNKGKEDKDEKDSQKIPLATKTTVITLVPKEMLEEKNESLECDDEDQKLSYEDFNKIFMNNDEKKPEEKEPSLLKMNDDKKPLEKEMPLLFKFNDNKKPEDKETSSLKLNDDKKPEEKEMPLLFKFNDNKKPEDKETSSLKMNDDKKPEDKETSSLKLNDDKKPEEKEMPLLFKLNDDKKPEEKEMPLILILNDDKKPEDKETSSLKINDDKKPEDKESSSLKLNDDKKPEDKESSSLKLNEEKKPEDNSDNLNQIEEKLIQKVLQGETESNNEGNNNEKKEQKGSELLANLFSRLQTFEESLKGLIQKQSETESDSSNVDHEVDFHTISTLHNTGGKSKMYDLVKNVQSYTDFNLLMAAQLILPKADSKDFVDRPTKRPIEEIRFDFNKLRKKLGLKDYYSQILEHKERTSKSSSSDDENENENTSLNNSNDVALFAIDMQESTNKTKVEMLKKFIDDNFDEPGTDLEPHDPEDWKETPAILEQKDMFGKKINNKDIIEVTIALNHVWKELSRKKVEKEGQDSTLLSLPYPFMVPGGRFREFYYWDTYFILEGLVKSKMYTSAFNIVRNFAHIIDTLGYIPNGTREYYKFRSQPPFFPLMLLKIMNINDEMDQFVLSTGLRMALKEYEWFKRYRSIQIKKGNKIHRLNYFHVKTDFPRPESLSEDIQTYLNQSKQNENEIYSNLKSGAESGWDFSSRWFKDDTIETISAYNQIPVDLNAIIYKNEQILSYLLQKIGLLNKAKYFGDLARLRYNSINEILWNPKVGSWNDFRLYDNTFVDKKFYFSNIFPLIFDIKPPTKTKSQIEDSEINKKAASSGDDCDNEEKLSENKEEEKKSNADENKRKNEIINLMSLFGGVFDNKKSMISSLLENGDGESLPKKDNNLMKLSFIAQKENDSNNKDKNPKSLVDDEDEQKLLLEKETDDEQKKKMKIIASLLGLNEDKNENDNSSNSIKSSKENELNNNSQNNIKSPKENESNNDANSLGLPLDSSILKIQKDNSIYSVLNVYKKELFSYKGGVPTSGFSEEHPSTQQWDFPNVWAPHQYLIVSKLFSLNEHDMALQIARAFFKNLKVGFKQNGVFYEKYNCNELGLTGKGGEYEAQTGFGWTNGTALSFIHMFGDLLDEDYDVENEYAKISDYLKEKVSGSEKV